MATLQATRILEALEKAKRVGRIEEAVTIDGCSLVLQNLTPDDYEAINDELEGLEDIEYLHAFQAGHVARSIVELAPNSTSSSMIAVPICGILRWPSEVCRKPKPSAPTAAPA